MAQRVVPQVRTRPSSAGAVCRSRPKPEHKVPTLDTIRNDQRFTTHFTFGCRAGQEQGPRHQTDSRSAFRQFSAAEIAKTRGTVADDVKADLRAVHLHLGSDKTNYESISETREKQGLHGKGDRFPVSTRETMIRLGCGAWDDPTRNSSSREGFRQFSLQEQKDAGGGMTQAAKADLRAVHAELGSDDAQWESSMMHMNRHRNSGVVVKPEKKSQDLRGSSMPWFEPDSQWASDYQICCRKFSAQEIKKAQPSMSKAQQADLRAVHYNFGFDKCYPHNTVVARS